MPSYNTYRKINFDSPRYQQAMRKRENASDYSVNPDTRAITNQFVQSEANRIRGLDDFGIQNRMAREALAFNKAIADRRHALNIDNLRMGREQLGMNMEQLGIDKDTLKDRKRASKLGMLIGLAQTGTNIYDQAQISEMEQARLAELGEQTRLMQAEEEARILGTTRYGFDPSADHKRLVGGGNY